MESSSIDGAVAPERWSSTDNWECSTSIATCGTVTTADGNMLAVATRIQERARRLLEEQTNLQKFKVQLEQIRNLKEKEMQTNRDEKRKQLEGIIARNQTELNLFALQDSVKEQKIKNQEVISRTRSIKDECERIQAQFNDHVETMYAPHEMELELYRKTLETHIENARKRQNKIDRIQSNIRQIEETERKLLQDKVSLIMECERFQKEELERVQDISNLAEEVKQALSKVSRSIFRLTETTFVAHITLIRLLMTL